MTATAFTGTDAASAVPDPHLLALGQILKAAAYRFVTVTPASHARVNARPGRQWGECLADAFGWSRPFRADAEAGALLELMRDAGIVQKHGKGWRSLLRASTLDGLLYFHSAYPTEANDAVFFGPDSYRFVRALDAELAGLGHAVRRAADIGCGAGPAALTVARRYPEAEVLALDINAAALRLTTVNAALAGLRNVSARGSNLLRQVAGEFDLIVANPPYMLDPAERAYRHGGGELGAGLSLAIVEAAIERLAPGGHLLLYTGVAIVDGVDRFRRAAAARLDAAGMAWRYEEIDPDVFGEELDTPAYAEADRIAAVWLKASKAP